MGNQDEQITQENEDQNPKTNPDPLTGETGSHPVGTGVGTAGGAVAGAAIGGVIGGPLGAAVGALVAGVAGAHSGRGVAEAINPTAEDEDTQIKLTPSEADADLNSEL